MLTQHSSNKGMNTSLRVLSCVEFWRQIEPLNDYGYCKALWNEFIKTRFKSKLCFCFIPKMWLVGFCWSWLKCSPLTRSESGNIVELNTIWDGIKNSTRTQRGLLRLNSSLYQWLSILQGQSSGTCWLSYHGFSVSWKKLPC